MQANSTSVPQPTSIFDTKEMASFRYFRGFNHFLYSYNKSNQLSFLLYKVENSSTFKHFSGEFTKHDAAIIFAVIREFLTQTNGLLCSQNLKYFLAENPLPFKTDSLSLVDAVKNPIRPQKEFGPLIDDVAKSICESPYIFQDQDDNVSYFIELPMLNLELVRKAAKENGLTFDLEYYSLKDILNAENNEICSNMRNIMQSVRLNAYITKFLINREPIEIRENYAIISCEPMSTNYMLPALYYSIFKRHGEDWRFYRAYEYDLPTDEELKRIKGILVPGSGQAAYSDNPWYKDLFDCIRKIHYDYKHISLLGICFGAQAFSQALGGRVAKMDRDFIREGETLNTNSSFYELDYVKPLNLDNTKPLVIAEAHGDHIVELPSTAILHASSVKTRVEIYTIGTSVLAFQGHPDYNEAWTAGSYVRKNNLVVDDFDKYAVECIKQKFPDQLTHKIIVEICYNFLKKDSKKAEKLEI